MTEGVAVFDHDESRLRAVFSRLFSRAYTHKSSAYTATFWVSVGKTQACAPTSRARVKKKIAAALIACTGLSALAGCADSANESTTSQELRDVNFMLSWVPDTNHIGVYVAREKGYYKEAGLNVHVLPLAQAGQEQAVNNGFVDFALSNMATVGSSSLKGMDLIQVMQVQQKPSAIWCALASNTEITRPKDLDGKIFATVGANEDAAAVTRMIQNDGGAGVYDSVTVGTSTFDVLQAGSADFGGFYSTWEGVQAEINGPKLNCFEGHDYGVPGNPNEIGVITKGSTASEDPEFVRAFVQATRRGYEYAYAHPDEAAELLVKGAAADGMEVDAELAKASMKFIVEEHYWGDPEAINNGTFTLGTADIPNAQAYYDFIAEDGRSYRDEHDKLVTTPPNAADLATDEFLK